MTFDSGNILIITSLFKWYLYSCCLCSCLFSCLCGCNLIVCVIVGLLFSCLCGCYLVVCVVVCVFVFFFAFLHRMLHPRLFFLFKYIYRLFTAMKRSRQRSPKHTLQSCHITLIIIHRFFLFFLVFFIS